MNNYLEQILLYSDGEMSEKDKTLFESELDSNPTLQEAYQDFMATRDMRDVLEYQALRSRMSTIAASKGKSRISWIKPLALAASLFLFLGIGLWIYKSSEPNHQALAQAYYHTPNFSANRDGQVLTSYERAINAFNRGDFLNCIDLVTNHNTVDAKYLLAHAYFNAEKYDKAHHVFADFTNTNDLRYQNPSMWFAALSLIELGQVESAKIVLSKIVENTNHAYFSDAQSLLSKL